MRIKKRLLGMVAVMICMVSASVSVGAEENQVTAHVSKWSSQGLVSGSINKCGAVVEVKNNSDSVHNCNVMLCMYDNDGRLVDIEMKEIDIGEGTVSKVNLDVASESNIYAEVKAFVWDTDMMALCPAIVRSFASDSVSEG